LLKGVRVRVPERLSSMTAGLAIGITAAVALACAAAAYFYSVHHFQSLLETARRTALAQGELIQAALEHQMIEKDRSLIERMIQTFGHQPRVERVMLLDRHGVARYTSAPLEAGDLALSSPTCQACHRYPPAQRESSRVIDTRGGKVLRTVIPVPNRAACYGCHDPSHRINGVLMLDVNAEQIRAEMNADLRWLVAGSCGLALVLVGAIGLVVRLVVLRRLRRFETTARLIAAGDLARRVPATGSDILAWLGRAFNTMADSVTTLVSEVRDQRERLERIINSIGDGIVVLDADRRVIAANDAFLQRTGHARGDVLGCCCTDVAPGMCSGGDCPTLACLASGERRARISQRRAPDGAIAWEEVHTSPIRDAEGQVVHVVEVWRDISDRRAAEARLAESHRLASLGMLASGFSHEINTPLATVLTCVEGILRDAKAKQNGDPSVGRIADGAAIAREQVLRCRGITQHFLRLSRGQRSPGDIVDVPSTVAAVARLVEPTARAHRVRIEAHAAAEGVQVRADSAELQHALINLLLNAVQVCQPGGTARIEIDGRDPVHIRVTDDGCGIAPEHQQRIFEPFFSLRKGGTGLGLFLALNFVRRWGGDILVASTPGAGSTFDVVLPAAGREVTVAGSAAGKVGSAAGNAVPETASPTGSVGREVGP
jgi:PAS domain S-box-containing protein